MIIKITVHDNDFTGIMNGFLSGFYYNICFGVDRSDFDWKRKDRFNQMLNPNIDKKS